MRGCLLSESEGGGSVRSVGLIDLRMIFEGSRISFLKKHLIQRTHNEGDQKQADTCNEKDEADTNAGVSRRDPIGEQAENPLGKRNFFRRLFCG